MRHLIPILLAVLSITACAKEGQMTAVRRGVAVHVAADKSANVIATLPLGLLIEAKKPTMGPEGWLTIDVWDKRGFVLAADVAPYPLKAQTLYAQRTGSYCPLQADGSACDEPLDLIIGDALATHALVGDEANVGLVEDGVIVSTIDRGALDVAEPSREAIRKYLLEELRNDVNGELTTATAERAREMAGDDEGLAALVAVYDAGQAPEGGENAWSNVGQTVSKEFSPAVGDTVFAATPLVQLRQEPESGAPVGAIVRINARLRVLEAKNDWLRIGILRPANPDAAHATNVVVIDASEFEVSTTPRARPTGGQGPLVADSDAGAIGWTQRARLRPTPWTAAALRDAQKTADRHRLAKAQASAAALTTFLEPYDLASATSLYERAIAAGSPDLAYQGLVHDQRRGLVWGAKGTPLLPDTALEIGEVVLVTNCRGDLLNATFTSDKSISDGSCRLHPRYGVPPASCDTDYAVPGSPSKEAAPAAETADASAASPAEDAAITETGMPPGPPTPKPALPKPAKMQKLDTTRRIRVRLMNTSGSYGKPGLSLFLARAELTEDPERCVAVPHSSSLERVELPALGAYEILDLYVAYDPPGTTEAVSVILAPDAAEARGIFDSLAADEGGAAEHLVRTEIFFGRGVDRVVSENCGQHDYGDGGYEDLGPYDEGGYE